MTFADMAVQGVDLEMAHSRLDNLVDDIETLKVKLAELIDDADVELHEGSRFRKLISVKFLLNSMGIDAFSARRGLKSALATHQASIPQPEDVA